MGTLALSYALIVLLLASGLIAAALHLDYLWQYTAAVFVLAASEVVGLSFVLSLVDGISSKGYVIGECVVLGAALAFWFVRGATVPPVQLRIPSVVREPLPALLLIVLGLALAYEVILVVGTPPNNWDSLWYHLSRAALWHQNHSLHYIEPINNEIINAYPSNAEIGLLYIFTFLRADWLAGGVQLVAVLALLVAIFGIARRLGNSSRAALFAAFVFASLPLSALEASTTQNDLVVAAFVATAAMFSLGHSRTELVLSGLAVGLAAGSKLTALLALPVLALIVLSAQPRRRLPLILASWAAGIGLLGAFTYAQNWVENHRLLGNPPDLTVRAVLTPQSTAATAGRLLYRFLDLSGTEAAGISGYIGLVLGAVFVAGLVAFAWHPNRRTLALAIGVAALASLPAFLPILASLTARSYEQVADLVGKPYSAATGWYGIDYGVRYKINQRANEDWGYFGPLGFFILLPTVVVTVILWFRGRVDRRSAALAVALPAYIAIVAVTLSYNEFVGRFLITPIALVVPLTASLWRWKTVAWAVAAVGSAMLFLNLAGNETKPSGLPFFGYEGQSYVKIDPGFHVWGQPRSIVQSLTRTEMRPVLVAVQRTVPRRSAVGLALNQEDWVYPFFGADLSNRVTFLTPPVQLASLGTTPPDWVIASPGGLPAQCAPGWTLMLVGDTGWTIAHRESADGSCKTVTLPTDPAG